jgi:hypothetical protein
MSKLQHTSGPWKYTISKNSGRHQISDAKCGGQVCAIWSRGKDITEANARLITAAPEMLIELLKSIAELDKTGFASITSETIIMKATGWSYDILNDVLTKLSTGMSIEEILK